MLKYSTGYIQKNKLAFRLKLINKGEVIFPSGDGEVNEWDGAVAMLSVKGDFRLFLLKPATEQNSLVFGKLSVSGNYKIDAKVNNSKQAKMIWESL